MEVYQWMMIIYFAILFLVGCVGNVMLLAIFWKSKNYSSVIVFIKALAVTDFYVCFTKPVGIIYWLLLGDQLDETFCKIFQFTVGTGYVLTFCMIFLVALDRYLAIYHTETSLCSVTVSHANILVILVWVCCHAGTVIKILFGQYLQEHDGKVFCAEDTTDGVYVSYSFMAFIFVLCCIVVLWINFQIIQAVKRQSKTTPNILRLNKPVQDATSSVEALTEKDRNQGDKQETMIVELDNADDVHTDKLKEQKKPSNEAVKKTRPPNVSKPKRAKRSKVITSLTKMLAVVTLVYVATSLPTIIIFFVPLKSELEIVTNFPFFYGLYLLLKYLFFIVSIVKPFIYYAVSRTFREQVRDFVKQLGM